MDKAALDQAKQEIPAVLHPRPGFSVITSSNTAEGAILVMSTPYSNIRRENGIEAVRKALETHKDKSVPAPRQRPTFPTSL